MEHIVTKKYHAIQQIENNSILAGGRKVITNLPFFQSDDLQGMIDNFISNDILSFEIPFKATKPEGVPNYYLKRVYSKNILTKYVDGIGVFDDNVLTTYVEMSDADKLTIGLERKKKALKWVYPECQFRLHVLFKDTFGEGLLAAQGFELYMKKTPFTRVNSNHTKNEEDGLCVDIYLKRVSKKGRSDIEGYKTIVEGSKLEDFNEL